MPSLQSCDANTAATLGSEAPESGTNKRKKAPVTTAAQVSTTARPPPAKKSSAQGASLDALKAMSWEQICDAENLSVHALLESQSSSNTTRSAHAANARASTQEKDKLIVKLKACVRYLDGLVASLQRERDDASAELENVQVSKQHKMQEVQDAKVAAERELECARSAQKDAESRLKEAEQREAELEQKRHELENALSTAEERDRINKQHHDQLVQQYDTLQAKLDDERRAKESAQQYSTSLQEFNNKLQQDVNAVNSRIEQLNYEKAELQEQHSIIKGQNKSLTEQLEHAKSTTQEKETARREAIEENSRLQTELSQVTSARDASVAEVSRLQESLDEAHQTADNAQRRAEDAEARVTTAEEKQSTLEQECFQAASERDDSQYKLKQKEEELDSYKDAMKRREEKLQTLSEKYGQLEQQRDIRDELVQELRGELAEVKARASSAESLHSQRGGEAAELRAETERLKRELTQAEQQIREGEELRRKMHNTIQELRGNIRVFCRVRPQLGPSPAGGETGFSFTYPSVKSRKGRGIDIKRPNARGTNQFDLDRVFDEQCSNDQVYHEVSELIQSVLDGFKVCIFAYGQTGSGKTHTMVGDGENTFGVLPKAINQLFEAKETAAQPWSLTMQASLFEIYKEEMRDLLGKNQARPTSSSDLQQFDLCSREQAQILVDSASCNRSMSSTAQNEESSRSHMIFRLHVQCSDKESGETREGVLDLVDLAGSENLKKSGSEGQNKKEAEAIHKGLAALTRVISSLAQNAAHVPYRDSKLTHELAPSLGCESSKTLLIVNVSASQDACEETMNSLRFASKANGVIVDPTKRKQRH